MLPPDNVLAVSVALFKPRRSRNVLIENVRSIFSATLSTIVERVCPGPMMSDSRRRRVDAAIHPAKLPTLPRRNNCLPDDRRVPKSSIC